MANPEPQKKEIESYIIEGTADETVHVGDCVLVTPLEAGKLPYVARVEKLEADGKNNVSVSVRWYYRPEDTRRGRRQFHGVKELFLSDHYGVESEYSIEGKCTVHSYKNYSQLKEAKVKDYFCRFEYKFATGGDFVPDCVAVFCKCEMPDNPDLYMVVCEECQDRFHPSCVGTSKEFVDRLRKYYCPECSSGADGKKSTNAYHRVSSFQTKMVPKRQRT